MKTFLSLLTKLLFLNITVAQTTAIPDVNFEQRLINLGLDTGTPDGSIPTANISAISSLVIHSSSITDLTGIEDFIALTFLDCHNNQLTTLDFTQNTALEVLTCYNNQLTSINLTQNTALAFLDCHTNQLTILDVSQNTALTELNCGDNQLICLNAKNGNNNNFTLFVSNNNPNLNCIEVDNVAYANANWNIIDTASSFNTSCTSSCSPVSINEHSLSSLNIYPNPTSGFINIDSEETKSNVSLRLTNTIGKVVLTKNYKSTNHIDLNLDVPKGLYLLQLESDGKVITKKIIKE